jgi:uncharacterized protein YjgD (DUF1641 family)
MTATIVLEDRVAGIEGKLDLILEELAHLRRLRNETEDLMSDVTMVAKDALREVTDTCTSMDLRPKELGELLRSAVQDARLLTETLHQLESAADFIKDARPIARDLLERTATACGAMQEKGYFNAVATGMRIGEALLTSHSDGDLKQMEKSVPYLVGLLRQLTRPESLQALESILYGFGKVQATMNLNKSLFEIMREMNSPDARRGVVTLVEFLKVVGSRNEASGAAGTQIAEG